MNVCVPATDIEIDAAPKRAISTPVGRTTGADDGLTAFSIACHSDIAALKNLVVNLFKLPENVLMLADKNFLVNFVVLPENVLMLASKDFPV